MAAYKGRDVAKLKNKGGKWKYMSEAEMLSTAEPFAPYRYVPISLTFKCINRSNERAILPMQARTLRSPNSSPVAAMVC